MGTTSILSGEMIPLWLALVVTIMAFIFVMNLAITEGVQLRATKRATKLLDKCAHSGDTSSFKQVEAHFMKKRTLLEKRHSLFKKFLECKERRYRRAHKGMI